MKRLFLFALLAALAVSFGASARTYYFDDVVIDGSFTMSGTEATSFTGTTFAIDASSTVVIDGATSVRGVSAGFTSLESPANRFGVSATIYMQIATTAVTGVTAITHTGSAPTVTWTANSFDFVGAAILDGVTISGDIDSAGKADFDYSPPAGAVNGSIIKSTFTTATAYSGTSAGLMVKSYFADTGTTITGGEFTGVYINVKQLAAMTGGAKSSIISGHNYGSGGSYQYLDYGCILYGDLTWGYVLSGGTSTYGLYFGDQTISTADIYLQNGETISNATNGDIKTSGNLTVENATNSGAVYVGTYAITYTQTSSYTVCTIPANADVLKVEVATTTAFSGGSGTTMNIGWSGTVDGYASALSVRSAGIAAGDEYGNLGDVGSSTRDVLAQITTDDSAGACVVRVYWTTATPGSP